jgi:hypothetical protein
MKNTFSLLKLVALIVCSLLESGPRLGAQGTYEYDWVGGQPGFSGELFLDAPSNASAYWGGRGKMSLLGLT